MVKEDKEDLLASTVMHHLTLITRGASDRNSIAQAIGESDQAIALVLGRLWKKKLIRRHTTSQGWRFYWSRNNSSVELVPDELSDTKASSLREVKKDSKNTPSSNLEANLVEKIFGFSAECEKPDFACSISPTGNLHLSWGGKLGLSLSPKEILILTEALGTHLELVEKLAEALELARKLMEVLGLAEKLSDSEDSLKVIQFGAKDKA
jgi:predicted transcriptional regulator